MGSAAQIPFSNPAGNNQMSPGGLPRTPQNGQPMPYQNNGPSQSSNLGQNPFFTPPGNATPIMGSSTASGVLPGGGTPGQPQPMTSSGNTNLTNSLNQSSYTYSNSTNDAAEGSSLYKQLTDIYGQGVGGELNNIMANMGGEDSAMFQQYLASMVPAEASETAGLNSQLGSSGVSGNSSVSAIANSNLQGQFNAQASAADQSIMSQGLQDTIGILQGTQSDAAKEVATSGWSTFANVMNNITGDVGNLVGGNYQSNSNPSGVGTQENFQPIANTGSSIPSSQSGVGTEPGYTDFSGMDPSSADGSMDGIDPSIFG
jgi:hypothetical protein